MASPVATYAANPSGSTSSRAPRRTWGPGSSGEGDPSTVRRCSTSGIPSRPLSMKPTLVLMGDGKVGGRLRAPGDHQVLLGRVAADLLRWPAWTSRWIPSDESDVFELTADGRAPRIVKVEREEMWCVRREELAFPALRSRGFDEFPEIEFATESLESAPASFMVMPKTEGRPLMELWAGDPPRAVWVVERIGDFLRRLVAVDWRDVPGVVTPQERVRGFARWLVSATSLHHFFGIQR